MSEMIFSPVLNKKIRKGDWSEQLISTYEKVCNAIREKRKDDATELLNYFMEEARICYDIYAQWSGDFIRYIEDQPGVVSGEVEGMNEDLFALLGEDGAPFNPRKRWIDLHRKRASLTRTIHGEVPVERLLEDMEDIRESWRRLHDRYVDYCYGILVHIANRFGEDKIGNVYKDYAIGDLFDYRYQFFAPDKNWEEAFPTLIYLTIESMRAHLCGPRRYGEMELTEDEEKIVVEFDACGSGGRSLRGDPVEGTPSRMEAPYHFRVTEEEYDWAWNKKGIGYYCAHCSVVLENLPLEKFGYPVRVLEPPTYPLRKDAKCKWIHYKHLESVPAEVWTRHGMVKPGSRPERQPTKTSENDLK